MNANEIGEETELRVREEQKANVTRWGERRGNQIESKQ